MAGRTPSDDASDASASASEPPLPPDAAELAGPLALRDGTMLYQRAIYADDAARLRAFHGRLSPQSIVLRFFGVMPELSSDLAERLSHVDYDNRMAVVATRGAASDESIVAVARYQRAEPDAAEIALVVEDDWQGHGIGPQLLETLAAYARRRGFTTLIAEVMYNNDHMLALLRHSSFPTTFRLHDGRVEARLDISGASLRTSTDQETGPNVGPAL